MVGILEGKGIAKTHYTQSYDPITRRVVRDWEAGKVYGTCMYLLLLKKKIHFC